MNPNHTSMLQPQHTNYQHPPHPHSGHVSGSSGVPGPPQQDHTQQAPEGLEVMHQQQQWAKCEPELSHPHANFGASTTTTSQQFYQQSCYYPPAQMYGSGGGSQQAQQMRPDSTDYANNSAGGFYHHNSNNERNNSNNSSGSGGGDVGASGGTEVGDCRQTQQQYYPTMDHSHQFPYDHSNNGSGHHVHTRNNSSTSCAMTAGNNFYNYYNNQNSHYNVSGYNNNSGSGVGGDEAEYQRRYFDQNQQSQHHHIEGYFGGYGPHPQQNSRYPHPNPHHLQYNNINNSHHPPFRRKSMESASYPTTEGYPTTNNNNSTKSYGVCSFNGNQQNNPQQQQSQPQQQQQQQPQQATYCSPSPAPSPSSSTSPAMMIKRECLSNPSSSMPIPPSGWVRQSTSNSSANSNPNCPSSSTQDYIYTGTNSSPYDQQSQQGQTSQEEYHHHQSTFKSCAFESGSGAPQTEMKLSNSSNNYNLKPGSVKHRSLSIPANYPPNQNDIHMHQVPSSVSGGCGSTVPDSENLEKIVVTSESLQYSATSYDQLNDGSGSGDDAYPTPAPSSNSNSAEECCTTQPQEVEEDDEEESEDEEEDDEDDETSSLLHEFDVDDIPESDMIIAEDEEEEDGQSHHEDDDQDMEKSFVGETSPKSLHIPEDNANNNVISTTVEGSSGCGGGGEEINSNSNSNTSFTSALFSLKRSNSISCAFSGSSTSNSCSGENNSTNNNNNNAQCDSGIGLSLSFSLNTSASSTTSSSGGSLSGSGASPQKIAKRSFSETDKHVVVVNAFSSSATCGESDNVPEMQVGVVGCGGSECSTNTGLSVTEHKKGGGVAVPKGWKREISFAKELVTVYYVSPSDTKLRNLEELKNYICSDGTCKCGLSCPLRLEHAFSFDPKVISVCGERKKKKLDSEDELMYLTGFKEHDEEIVEEEPKTTLCNHYKRKIPKSEDSPLISSTRDDLGDCPDKRTKKRRTSDSSEFSTSSSGNAGNATPTHQAITPKESPTAPLVNAGGRISHVAVPCSQQSPDTTTQIPQTEMSPASSVSSEPTASSRSLCSTPTPPSSAITTPVKGVGVTTRSSAAKGNDFAWPTTTTSSSATNSPSRKSTHHHLIPTKSKSPCPNVDVRQIPLEKNRPPPKPGQIFPPATEATIINPPPTLPPIIDLNCLTTTSTINSTPISAIISTPSSSSSLTPTLTASHSTFGFNSPLHSFTNSELRELQNLPMTMNLNGMNCGFTISPIMNPTTTMSYLNQPLTIPLEIQKLIGASATPGSDQSNLFQQFHQPQVLFSIPQQQQQIHTQNLVTSVNTVDDKLEKISEKAADSSESKSPLQMVQDVVNRVDKEKDNEKKEDTGDKSEEKKKDEGNNEKETREEKSGRKDSEPCVKTDKEQTKPEESQTETDNGKETKSAEGDANANEVAKQISSTPTSISTSTVSSAPQIILHQGQSMPTTTMSFTTGTPTTNEFGQMRYPIIQTIQPFFSTGGPLIFSSPQQTTQTQDVQNQGQGGQGQTQNQNQQHHPQQQSFIYHPQDQQLVNMQDPNSTFTMPFTFDPSSSTLCAQNLNSIISGMSPLTLQAGPNVPNSPPGNKKKKKRLSKKQQQQQAQIQLQQQLLIQQIQAQQQAQQALNAAFPLTIFNNSFPLNFQPMNMNMPFFQPQTILTLPNLILNPADGTLFLQPSAPMSTTTTSTIQPASAIINRGGQTTPTLLQPGNPLIAPKKDGSEGTTTPKSDAGSDDLRRNNPTPDSSTGDVVQLAILSNNGNTPTSLNTSTTTTPIPSPIIVGSGGGQTILPQTNKKTSIKSRAVVSSTIKRVFHQKQILPKIDSTTPPND